MPANCSHLMNLRNKINFARYPKHMVHYRYAENSNPDVGPSGLRIRETYVETCIPSGALHLCSEFFVGLFHIQFGEDEGNQEIEAHRHPKVHDMEHIHAGCALLCCAAYISAKCQ